MIGAPLATVVWIWGAAQVLGLATAWFARRSTGKHSEASWHRLFFLALLVVAGSSFGTLGLGPICYLVSGTTLALMAVTATLDTGRLYRTA